MPIDDMIRDRNSPERKATMPVYLQKEVSDAYLQSLIASYRKGYTAAGGTNVEDSDQPILTELTQHVIVTQEQAEVLGASVAKKEQQQG